MTSHSESHWWRWWLYVIMSFQIFFVSSESTEGAKNYWRFTDGFRTAPVSRVVRQITFIDTFRCINNFLKWDGPHPCTNPHSIFRYQSRIQHLSVTAESWVKQLKKILSYRFDILSRRKNSASAKETRWSTNPSRLLLIPDM